MVILLFTAAFEGVDAQGLLSMSMLLLLNDLRILSLAGFSVRFGSHALVSEANSPALAGYFLATSTPW